MITTDLIILRAKNQEVKPEEIPELIKQLELELEQSAKLGRDGVGLAAPQIGLNKKIAIVRFETNQQSYHLDLVNARIDKAYDLQTFEGEGCLSMPGQSFNTKRHQEVHVVDNAVEPHSFIATGFLAVVIQHELDHLDGVLASDRAIKSSIQSKVGPNDACICGSKRKFKKCCGKL